MNRFQQVPWLRIGAEAAAIITSILLAFWIQAWWESKVEQEEFLSYLVALEREFVDTRKHIEQNITANAQINDAANEIFAVLADTSNPELPESFENLVGKMYTILNPVSAIGAYSDIVNSGHLRLIRNGDLRSRLNQYMDAMSAIEIHNRKFWDAYYDIHLPFLSQHVVVSRFGWDAPNPIIHDVSIRVGKETPPAPFENDESAVRSKIFWNLVYDWKVANTDQARHLLRMRQLCDAILVLLQSEIKTIST